MTLFERLLESGLYNVERNIVYQKDLERPGKFEKEYIELRDKENRIYSDATVRDLPEISSSNTYYSEWKIRKASLVKLIQHLKKRESCHQVLELGCGNGWLSHQLAVSLDAAVCALDVNETELNQGARVFSSCEKLIFMYADIFTMPSTVNRFDTIILASSIQYFQDLKKLIGKLFELLATGGEIHILDSPLYSPSTVASARDRSAKHFTALGHPQMTTCYFHHMAEELESFSPQVLFNPGSIFSIISGKLLRIQRPVFPWIVIKQN